CGSPASSRSPATTAPNVSPCATTWSEPPNCLPGTVHLPVPGRRFHTDPVPSGGNRPSPGSGQTVPLSPVRGEVGEVGWVGAASGAGDTGCDVGGVHRTGEHVRIAHRVRVDAVADEPREQRSTERVARADRVHHRDRLDGDEPLTRARQHVDTGTAAG